MGKVVKFKKPDLSKKADGKSMCTSGFHKWEIVKEKQFDVKQGKLVTLYRCKRCGLIKSKAL
jgi:hypothetical protein